MSCLNEMISFNYKCMSDFGTRFLKRCMAGFPKIQEFQFNNWSIVKKKDIDDAQKLFDQNKQALSQQKEIHLKSSGCDVAVFKMIENLSKLGKDLSDVESFSIDLSEAQFFDSEMVNDLI
mmetsp:Transcript_10095/g.8606  ORF Transcript_10095/g.8606 Transcript_10095/m.8606 type:complete len:120 (+) Transcript_10095:569-928(+)